jgi:putative membrane protein
VITVLKFLLKVVLMGGVFYVMTLLLEGVEVVGNEDAPLGEVGTFLWIALIFAVINAIIGPILRLLSLPFILLTLGLFLLVVNAALLGLTALLTDRLQVDGFLTAVVGGLILAVGGWIADQILDR